MCCEYNALRGHITHTFRRYDVDKKMFLGVLAVLVVAGRFTIYELIIKVWDAMQMVITMLNNIGGI